MALLTFDVGVETGQILFIVVVVALLEILRRFPLPVPEGARRLVPYAIGAIAAFWTVERVRLVYPAFGLTGGILSQIRERPYLS